MQRDSMMARRRVAQRHVAQLIIVACAVAAPLAACSTTGGETGEHPLREEMIAELDPLRLDRASQTPTIREYYRRTRSGVDHALHDTGTVPTLGSYVAVHVWRPPGIGRNPGAHVDAVGTVFVVHGYLANPLQHDDLIAELLGSGFIVVAPELPGHALSGGRRGAIDDFSDYGRFMADVIGYVRGRLPQPWHAVGHSTGATSIYELIRTRADPFSQIVFVAPLVRSKF
jgi:pimeloyl-ACP methyl ester carboxylesterase